MTKELIESQEKHMLRIGQQDGYFWGLYDARGYYFPKLMELKRLLYDKYGLDMEVEKFIDEIQKGAHELKNKYK